MNLSLFCLHSRDVYGHIPHAKALRAEARKGYSRLLLRGGSSVEEAHGLNYSTGGFIGVGISDPHGLCVCVCVCVWFLHRRAEPPGVPLSIERRSPGCYRFHPLGLAIDLTAMSG